MNPPLRVTPFAWLGLLVGCGGLLVCLCVAVAGGVLVWQQPWVGIAPGRVAVPPVNRIAYEGTDGNIYTVAPDGSDSRPLTSDGLAGPPAQRLNRFPTWSPDSRYIAFVKASVTAGSAESQLSAVPLEGGAVETLHTATGFGPFYLNWAPDSRQLAFLESSGQSIALRLATLGQSQSQQIGSGTPFYFDWSPDSQNLLFHIGGIKRMSPQARVSLLQPGQTESAPLSDDPALFLAPDWSPDGKTVLFARKGPGGDEVVAAEANGANPRQVMPFRGAVSFAWSPRGDQIAYILTDSPESQGLGQIAFGRLALTDAQGDARRILSEERVLAFFWSPDQTQIAYLTITTASQGSAPGGSFDTQSQGDNELRLRWSVVDVATGVSRALATFIPTEDFLSLIPFFDQYARSLNVWSPDSRSLVYAVAESETKQGVYVVDVAPDSQPRRIADGVQAAWSWR